MDATLTIQASQDDPDTQQPAAPVQALAPTYVPERDSRAPLSDWFARPAPTEDQLARCRSDYEEAKAEHVDATDKLERLNGEVRRFTEALDVPKELEPIVAAAQTAEVKARVLDGNLAAAEAIKALKLAQKRFDAAITAAREAEIVLPDLKGMVEEQRRVVDQKKQARWKAEEALGDASAAQMMHGVARGHLTSLLMTIGKLQTLSDEFGCAQPLRIKLEYPNGGWFEPREINTEA